MSTISFTMNPVVAARHYVGSAPPSYDLHGRIMSAVCLRSSPPPEAPLRFPVLWVPLRDVPDPEVVPGWVEVAVLLQGALQLPRPTLWHCAAGLNRSAYALGVYLVCHRGVHPEDAVAMLRRARGPSALSNTVMVEQLLRARPGLTTVTRARSPRAGGG